MNSDSLVSPNATISRWVFSRFWAIAALGLIAVTYRLWFPAAGFPLIPFFGMGHWAATMLTMISGPLIVVTLFWITVQPDRRLWRWWFVAAGLLVAFSSDQHRLQPWAYQTVLYAVIFAFGRRPDSKPSRAILLIAASIYLYSAAGKFDYQFTHTVGQDFLQTAIGWSGLYGTDFFTERRYQIALLFPAIESLLGIGLLLPLTRRAAGIGIIAMHATLLLILGPFGLDHSNGVLVWNIALGVQAWMIFVRRPNAKPVATDQRLPENMASQTRPIFRLVVVGTVCSFALIAPLGERRGYWDHWLSWALYSPHNSRVICEVAQSAVDRLPESVQSHVMNDDDQDGWRQIDFNSWSLECTATPVYPQSRYQRLLAADVAVNYHLNSSVRAIVFGTSDRWTGERETTWLLGTSELVPAKRKERWE